MHQAIPVTSRLPKMSACNEFVEHIWKPGSCKNCFCLQSAHQQSPAPTAQPVRPGRTPPEEEGFNLSPCSKPTIAVKPTMMSAEGADMGSEAPQVLWRPTPSKLPLQEPRDALRTFSGRDLGPCSLAASSRLGLLRLARPGSRDAPSPDSGGHVEGASPPGQESVLPAYQSFHQKLATFLERAGGSAAPHSGIVPTALRAKELQSSPQRDPEGGEYCSIADCCPTSTLPPAAGPGPGRGHGKDGPVPRGADEAVSPSEEGWGPSLRKEHCCQSRPEHVHPLALAQRKLPQALEAASLSDGPSSLTAGYMDGDYCSLSRQPEPRWPCGPGPRGESPSRSPGSPTQSSECSPPEPIYAEVTKRKKPYSASSDLPGTNKQSGCDPGQGLASDIWGQGRARPDTGAQVAATVTIVAAHPEDDRRTICLRSPDSAVGVQWPCEHVGPGLDDTPTQILELPPHNHLPGPRGEDVERRCPAIPPKVCKGSPGGAHGSPEGSPLVQFKDGHWNQPAVSGLTDVSASLSSPGTRDLIRGLLPAQSSSWDQRRPRFQVGARSYQGRIEEEEEEEQQLDSGPSSLGTAREMETTSHTRRPRAESISEQPSRGDRGTGLGMSKSASFAFEFPKDRSEVEKFCPPPPPPKSRHLLRMNKSSPDLEQASHGVAESLSPPGFGGLHVHFTTGSTDSLTSDSQSCSEGGLSLEPACCPSSAPVASPVQPEEDESTHGPLQPPPLPQKRTVSRAASSPDGLFLTQGSLVHRTTSPRLNPSHSETSICFPEDSRSTGRGPEAQLPGSQGLSLASSQLSVSSQTSASSCPPQQQPSLLASIASKEATYAKLSDLYTQSLLRLAARCEQHFMGDQGSEPLRFSENSWSLFKLTRNQPCCRSGDAVYYCATCSQDPSRAYAVKICKMLVSKEAPYSDDLSVPIHFNLQQDCGHFVASVPSSMLLCAGEPQDQDCVVVITREVPHQTAADFVKDSASRHWAEPEAYERRVCLLLLQLCQGLESLKEQSITHRALCLENLLLVPCPGTSPGDQSLPRLLISNFLQAKQQPRGGGGVDEQQRRTQARLAPEIVAAAQYKKFDEFQTGILIYELLHQPNPFEEQAQLQRQDYQAEDLPPVPTLSLYSAGLQRLAHRLLEADPIKRLHIAEAKRALQCLLWGPRRELLQGQLQNWLHMKRALLLMKLAEKALDEQATIELEDWLCCQYLASSEPGALQQTLRLLQPL
uniref:PEAK1 related, kinase-activating pseudokinase 1 n=1 Tax=Monodelphis domestica TaxID=13616 RepID=F7FNN2_MONDO